ncbi:hypothetical protein KC640_03470 [Candidatus Dojkabacteria bacterium]|uniref:DUF2238 domain-containing protein n=1 Tax=Candidatus Dojkabacteria bacterium TaxID=2099670 RepID=A0A955IA17_9BACT|nr:hypothetical protein [Candidatus Dojkabacteria bacterium]
MKRPIVILPIGVITFFTLQSLGLFTLTSRVLALGWLGYLVLGLVVLLVIDNWKHFALKEMNWIYIAYSLHMTIFSLVEIYDAYSVSPLVNRIEHAVGGALLMWTAWVVVKASAFATKTTIATQMIFAFGIGTMFGVINEIIELGLDFFLHTNTIGPELWDTNLDLLMNWLGMGLFIIVLVSLKQPRRQE